MARLLLGMFITGCQILRAALPALMCNVTKLNDASILYQIFGKLNSTNYYSSWEKENMSFSCFKASNADITRADLLYLPDMHDQSLWESNDPTPHCSSVSPPAPSQCLGCFQESLYAVCSKLLEKIPIMEGDGKHINVTKSACPTFKAEPTWWIILLVIIIFILGVVIYNKDKIHKFRGRICVKTEEDNANDAV